MPERPSSEAPQRLGFLLLPRYSMLAFVSTVEPLRAANRLAGAELYCWDILSRGGGPIAASNGMSLVADRGLADAGRCSMVVVCASFDPERHYDRRMGDWLRRVERGGADLGAVDGGSFILARAGLLDGYRATTHWESLDSFREAFPRVEIEPGFFVFDRNRVTLRRRHGRARHDAAHQLAPPRAAARGGRLRAVHPCRDPRTQGASAHGPGGPAGHRALGPRTGDRADGGEPRGAGFRRDACRRRRPVAAPARARSFRRHLATTPNRYYLDLRLQRARSLLQYSDLSVLEIAITSGFGSAAHFRAAIAAGRASRRAPTAAGGRLASCRRCAERGGEITQAAVGNMQHCRPRSAKLWAATSRSNPREDQP